MWKGSDLCQPALVLSHGQEGVDILADTITVTGESCVEIGNDLCNLALTVAALEDFGGSLTDTVRARLPEVLEIGLAQLREWGIEPVARAPGEAAPLFDPSLAIDRYEGGRPPAEEACRVGDPRFLPDLAGREA